MHFRYHTIRNIFNVFETNGFWLTFDFVIHVLKLLPRSFNWSLRFTDTFNSTEREHHIKLACVCFSRRWMWVSKVLITMQLLRNLCYRSYIGDDYAPDQSLKDLIKSVCKLGEWQSFASFYIMSSALEEPIFSYYPSMGHRSHPLNKKVAGRNVDGGRNEAFIIMWTSTAAALPFRPNHFVPIDRMASYICHSTVLISKW